uniref:chemerin-like receptor 1 n=1 Tax=Pristiophorus japonicus TaxID=55135 RepID=UPI00398F8CA0
MKPEDLQLIDSKVPCENPVTEEYSSMKQAMYSCAIAIEVITCVLGLLGNGLVIWATGFKLKRTANTVWLLSLAVADFTVSLLLPLFITELVLDNHWPFGWLLCKLSYGMVVLCVFVSILTLAAISLDRCVSVVLPVWSRNHRGPRPVALLSLGVWVAAVIGSSPSFAFQKFVSRYNWTRCCTDYMLEGEQAQDIKYVRDRVLTLVRFLLGFLLPFLVIATSYTIIWLRLRWGRLVPSYGKSFRVMAAIILAFLLCWAPYHIISILQLLQPQSESQPPVLIVGAPLSYSLAFLNSCINPILYIFMWHDFRDLLKKSFQCVDNQGESTQSYL